MGFADKEWEYLAKMSEDHGADMLELNFSCPNMTIEGSGDQAGKSFYDIEHYTSIVKKAVSIPVMAKMTPNITDMTETAMAAKNGGADAISAINTVSGISGIDLDSLVPQPNVFGRGASSGTSGPGVKPIGLRFISDMAKDENLNLPLSGMGGIETWIDALQYLLVGASTLQVTTGIMHYGYVIVQDMIEGLSDYMASRGIMKLEDLIGATLPKLGKTELFDLDRQGVVEYNLDKCVGCGQCLNVCTDAGGQALSWDAEKRRPEMNENKCLSCMLCSFVCPVSGLIKYKAMPEGWKRDETIIRDPSLEKELKYEPYVHDGDPGCLV
jgi:dihydropyrimidine dehydrogenase (NAD+) subunit PreA